MPHKKSPEAPGCAQLVDLARELAAWLEEHRGAPPDARWSARLRTAVAMVEAIDDHETAPAMLRRALVHLREARRLARLADAPRALDRIRAAISSAEGAERHAQRAEGPDA